MTNAVRNIVIVGGGTAGWLTAGYLAKQLGADLPGGARVTLVESPEIGILGVGEGTFPTIRNTLARIGVREADLIRRCDASFKQGASFVGWRQAASSGARDRYLHAFQDAPRDGPELLPYWLLGMAGDLAWDEASTPQKRAVDAHRGPKLPAHPDYAGPLNYAFHFDAVALAALLREQGIANGVVHKLDAVEAVHLGEDGSIAQLSLRGHGTLTADLYIDCTGFRAELIGKALGQRWTSCRSTLFCNAAIALQLPHADSREPIASSTLATAQASGWIWDIALGSRRGLGHVYSADHCDAEEAERSLRAYAGPAAEGLEVRHLRFEAGYRETSWFKNCVAVGLSSGFFEPLEATGIVFAEVAASLIANLFPWAGDFETSARQFNANMQQRYVRTLDFLKMHYCLSERRDSSFWRDNADRASVPDTLADRLDRWRFRPPNEMDVDANVDIFPEASWQYVLYGMGWKTDLSAKAAVYRRGAEARAAFDEIRRHSEFAVRELPSNRDLIQAIGAGARANAA